MQNSERKNLTVRDIANNPRKYGAPTFAEYVANPDKYRSFGSNPQNILSSVDKGSVLLRDVKRQIYYVNEYRCDSLEQAERIANDMGHTLGEFNPQPEMRQTTDGKYEIHVYFKFETKTLNAEAPT